MFDLDQFIEDCRAAVARDDSHRAVRALMEETFADPAAVMAGLGEPTIPGIVPLYRSDTLTILNFIWKPGMVLYPHDHRMWAVIGLYGGQEDNMFWRRLKDDPAGRIEAAGGKSLMTGDVTPLGRDIIHSVRNPLATKSAGLHVYGGDFFGVSRSQWDKEHLTEQAYDSAQVRGLFL